MNVEDDEFDQFDRPERPPWRGARSTGAGGFAPWWVTLLVILAANRLRVAVHPDGIFPEWVDVLLALTVAAVVFVAVTAVYRALRATGVGAPDEAEGREP